MLADFSFLTFLTTFAPQRPVESGRIRYENASMLLYFLSFENLPTFLKKSVGKIFVNLKNVQHRQISTWMAKPLGAVQKKNVVKI